MKTSQRRQALLDIFDRYERMTALLSCLAHSPALWGDEADDADEEGYEIKEQLEKEGLLRVDANTYTTTEAGRQALIAYINDEPVEDRGYDDCHDLVDYDLSDDCNEGDY